MPSRAWVLVHPKGVVVRKDDPARLLDDADALALAVDPASGEPVGTFEGREVRAANVEATAPLPEAFMVLGLRESFGALGEERFLLAGRAAQLVEWRATHKHCGRCATPTERVAGERCVRCSACGLLAYPRIAPAVIVLVRRGDEALLARGARLPAGMYSTLAGFVEVGETLEETIAREIREEVGIDVKNPRYFGSQPWPFPHSLMLAFMAEWASGEVRADGTEILDARFFHPDALPAIPPRISIARAMIDAWLDDVRANR